MQTCYTCILFIYNIYSDHLLKGPQGRSPTCINKSINLRFLSQGTLMNLFGCASPPPGVNATLPTRLD